jgi:hypothetical protein
MIFDYKMHEAFVFDEKKKTKQRENVFEGWEEIDEKETD